VEYVDNVVRLPDHIGDIIASELITESSVANCVKDIILS